MKRTLSLSITSIIYIAVIAYCIYLTSVGALSVTSDLIGNEILVGVGLSILLVVVRYFSTFGAYKLNKPKVTLSLGGLIIIFCGAYLLIDPAGANTFLSDIMRIVGVYTIIAALSGFIGPIVVAGPGGSSPRVKNAEIIEI